MLRAGHGLVLISLTLLVIGVVMVNSAGLMVREESSINLQAVMMGKTAILAAVAMGCLFLGSLVPVDKLALLRGAASPVPWIILGMFVLLTAVHVPGIGREVNGASRWIPLAGPIGFQPSELAKWGMVIVLAWFAVRQAERVRSLLHGFVPAMGLVGVVCALIATEDLGTAALIGLVGVCMMLAAGTRIWQALLLLPLGVAGFIAALIASPYRVDRIRAFLNPYDDPQGIGYHIVQSMASIAGGGWAGRGLGNSVQKFGYLPEDTTDFIFAIVCEELGITGAAVVIALYTCLLLCGLSIVRRTADTFSRLVALGVMLTISLQAAINIAVVTGSAPTKGIALPLLSSGGTGWLMTAFCIGLLVSIDRTNRRDEVLRQIAEELHLDGRDGDKDAALHPAMATA